MSKSDRISASQCRRPDIHQLRAAGIGHVGDVAAGPPVRFQTSQLSMVPNRTSPASAFSRAPGTLSSSQRSFSPEK